MPDRWAGIKVGGSEIICVVLDIDDFHDSVRTVVHDVKIPLQSGPRPEAYLQAQNQILDFLQQNRIKKVAVIGSVVNHTGNSLPYLQAAELRGVVQVAAIQAGATVHCQSIGVIKKSKDILGPLATTAYMNDDAVWASAVPGLKKGSRDVGIAVIAAQKQEIA